MACRASGFVVARERERDVEQLAELDREVGLHEQALGRDVDGHAVGGLLVAAAQGDRQLGVDAGVAVAAALDAVLDLEAQAAPAS